MDFENEIKNLQTITNWNQKLKKIKIISKNIEKEEKKINKLSSLIDEDLNEKNNAKINLDEYLEKFYNENDLNNKIKIYKQIRHYINNIEKDIFDE